MSRQTTESTTTRQCDANYYLDDSGNAMTRDEFLAQLPEYLGHMLFVGEGFCPLRVAVLSEYREPAAHSFSTASEESRGWEEARESFETWCRAEGRAEEIGETDEEAEDERWGEYTLYIENIPLIEPVDWRLWSALPAEQKIFFASNHEDMHSEDVEMIQNYLAGDFTRACLDVRRGIQSLCEQPAPSAEVKAEKPHPFYDFIMQAAPAIRICMTNIDVFCGGDVPRSLMESVIHRLWSPCWDGGMRQSAYVIDTIRETFDNRIAKASWLVRAMLEHGIEHLRDALLLVGAWILLNLEDQSVEK